MKKNALKNAAIERRNAAADLFDNAVRKAALEISEKGNLMLDCMTAALDALESLCGYAIVFNPDFAEKARNDGYDSAEANPLPDDWNTNDAASFLTVSLCAFRANRDAKDGYKNDANFRDMFETLYRVENLCGNFTD